MKRAVSLDCLKVPCFVVVNGEVIYHMGGHLGKIQLGQELYYKKHGTFIVEYASTDYGIIHHVSRFGWAVKVFIPEKKSTLISDGRWSHGEVNWDSYEELAKKLEISGVVKRAPNFTSLLAIIALAGKTEVVIWDGRIVSAEILPNEAGVNTFTTERFFIAKEIQRRVELLVEEGRSFTMQAGFRSKLKWTIK